MSGAERREGDSGEDILVREKSHPKGRVVDCSGQRVGWIEPSSDRGTTTVVVRMPVGGLVELYAFKNWSS